MHNWTSSGFTIEEPPRKSLMYSCRLRHLFCSMLLSYFGKDAGAAAQERTLPSRLWPSQSLPASKYSRPQIIPRVSTCPPLSPSVSTSAYRTCSTADSYLSGYQLALSCIPVPRHFSTYQRWIVFSAILPPQHRQST